jgi:hypothetical protein
MMWAGMGMSRSQTGVWERDKEPQPNLRIITISEVDYKTVRTELVEV